MGGYSRKNMWGGHTARHARFSTSAKVVASTPVPGFGLHGLCMQVVAGEVGILVRSDARLWHRKPLTFVPGFLVKLRTKSVRSGMNWARLAGPLQSLQVQTALPFQRLHGGRPYVRSASSSAG